jgi:hypothetical protein
MAYSILRSRDQEKFGRKKRNLMTYFFFNPQSSSSTQISKTISHSHYDENKKIQQLIAQIWMGPNTKLLDVRICQDLVYLVIEEEQAEKNLL